MSLFERVVARPRPLWVRISISLLLLLLPFGAVALDDAWDSINLWQWRYFLVSPVIIIYIWVVSQVMAKSDANMLRAFRPLVQIDDDSFDQLVRKGSRINPIGEVIAIIVGVLLGLGFSLTWLVSDISLWVKLYIPISLGLMHGLLWWTVYTSIASTKLTSLLHRQPLKIDTLDIKPFEPIGRHSLVTSLIFVGGITLGVLFGMDIKNILAWQNLVFNLPIFAVPVISFYLTMGETHRVLLAEKKRQLGIVSQKIYLASHVIQSHISREEKLDETAVEYPALVAYETRLRAASTWPYNTTMVRTLYFTVVVPIMVRILSRLLLGF